MEDRQRQVRAVWAWLPAFRAIAETEHLPTAARRLGITPPALSRTLKLLEDELGQPLFRRVGRRLELAPAGEALRASVRDAMRRVHDAMERLDDDVLAGPVLVSAQGLVVDYALDALVHLARTRPALRPELSAPSDVVGDLLSGRLDVALQTATVVHDRLTTELIGTERTSVWCGPGHPLYRRAKVDLDEVCAHAFVAPPPLPDGRALEGWPSHLPRTVTLRVHLMHLGASIVQRGAHLAVLPDVTARAASSDLWRVPVDVTPPARVHAIARRPLTDEPTAARVVIDAVRDAIARGAPNTP